MKLRVKFPKNANFYLKWFQEIFILLKVIWQRLSFPTRFFPKIFRHLWFKYERHYLKTLRLNLEQFSRFRILFQDISPHVVMRCCALKFEEILDENWNEILLKNTKRQI